MSLRDGISEALLLEALEIELAGTPGLSVLLIGVEACTTVAATNALVGPASVHLLHLDRAAGGVACGLGNAEWMLGDDADAGAVPLRAGAYGVVGLNVEAARSYRLLREIVVKASALVTSGGCVLVAGPKKGGAEVAAATLREQFESVELEQYRKGRRVYRASRPRVSVVAGADSQSGTHAHGEQPIPAAMLELRGQTLQLVQDERIFARGQLDPATRMLAEVFEVQPGADLLDLGCGGGVLGILSALLAPTARCTLVDADPLAVAAARRGAALSGAANVSVHLSDVLAELPGRTFDTIVMNPPFHRGRAHDPALAERFLTQASAALRPGGRLWVVCNRFLPYERTLAQLLGAPREAAGDRSYKVLVVARN